MDGELKDVARSSVASPPCCSSSAALLELAYLAGHSRPAIAAALGIPVGTVKVRLRIGLGKLRLALAVPAMPVGHGVPTAPPPSWIRETTAIGDSLRID